MARGDSGVLGDVSRQRQPFPQTQGPRQSDLLGRSAFGPWPHPRNISGLSLHGVSACKRLLTSVPSITVSQALKVPPMLGVHSG